MTNEQREAVKMVEDIKNNTWTTKYIMSSDSKKADTVLSLIKEQEKQIDLMAEYIDEIDVSEDICEEKTMCDENCKDCIKQYFERKVEDVKN